MAAWLIIMPLLAVLALNLPWKGRREGPACWVGLALCLLQIGLALQPKAFFWQTSGLWLERLLIFTPLVDQLALVMFLAIGIVGGAALLVCCYTPHCADNRFMVINLVILALAGMNGVVLANDLFSLYVFLEITAVASYILIAVEKKRDAFEGAFKYL
ncbi:MAG: hypothetical protein GX806_03830, partial [Lentisphaerae bacterium]|nr:hypothetical protein [Lentisphaerota bacterium]